MICHARTATVELEPRILMTLRSCTAAALARPTRCGWSPPGTPCHEHSRLAHRAALRRVRRRRSPSTSPPASGKNWTTPSGPSSPSAPAAAAAGCTRSAPTPSTTARSAKAPRGWPTTSKTRRTARPLSLRHRLRHAARSRAICRAVRRDHGRRRLHGLFPRRLPQHAGTVVRGALQAVLLRHHGHGQPQSAQRQRGEGLLVDRRAIAAAARSGRDRPRDERPPRSIACRSPRRWPQGKVVYLPGGSRRGVSSRPCRRRASPGPRELKIIYSPLHGVGASAVLPALAADGFSDVEAVRPARRRPTAIFPTCPATSPIPRTRRCSTRSSSAAKRVGADLILATDPDCDRIGLAAPLTPKPGAAWAHADRQSDRRAADRLRAGAPQSGRHAHAASTTSSRRWSPPN